jgi:prepilin-type N-terminal cleavage/methylation domain-containing protein
MMRRTVQAGFSLLEVLIALGIFALVVIPLLNLEISSAAEAGQVSLERRAHFIAMQKLDRLLSMSSSEDTTEKVDGFDVESHATSVETVPGLQRLAVYIYYTDQASSSGSSSSKKPEMLDHMTAYRLQNPFANSSNNASPSPSASPVNGANNGNNGGGTSGAGGAGTGGGGGSGSGVSGGGLGGNGGGMSGNGGGPGGGGNGGGFGGGTGGGRGGNSGGGRGGR